MFNLTCRFKCRSRSGPMDLAPRRSDVLNWVSPCCLPLPCHLSCLIERGRERGGRWWCGGGFLEIHQVNSNSDKSHDCLLNVEFRHQPNKPCFFLPTQPECL